MLKERLTGWTEESGWDILLFIRAVFRVKCVMARRIRVKNICGLQMAEELKQGDKVIVIEKLGAEDF